MNLACTALKIDMEHGSWGSGGIGGLRRAETLSDMEGQILGREALKEK